MLSGTDIAALIAWSTDESASDARLSFVWAVAQRQSPRRGACAHTRGLLPRPPERTWPVSLSGLDPTTPLMS